MNQRIFAAAVFTAIVVLAPPPTSPSSTDPPSSTGGGCRKAYYLTKSTHQGDTVLTACDTGFHVASVHSIAEPSAIGNS